MKGSRMCFIPMPINTFMVFSRYALVASLIILGVSCLHADGCFVWNKGVDLSEPSQKAIIYWNKGREVLILQVRYEGPAEDFGWIVPLPAKPAVTIIEDRKTPFEELSRYTQFREKSVRPMMSASPGGVTVVEMKTIGVYDIAVLRSTDATALDSWLEDHRFFFPRERVSVLKHYVVKGWWFVATRINREALVSNDLTKLKTGNLQPLRFEFACTKMVYPLRISSANAGKTEVLLYVLADVPMVADDGPLTRRFDMERSLFPAFPDPYLLEYYLSPDLMDPVYGTYPKANSHALPATWDAISLPKDAELFLFKYRATYDDREMVDDLTFRPFEPVAYWKVKANSAISTLVVKARALCILAAHDKEKYSKEILQALPELLKGGEPGVYPFTPTSWFIDSGNAPRDLKCYIYARSEESGLRSLAADDPNIPADLLARLASDPDAHVRAAVAKNSKTLINLVRKLAHDRDPEVRENIAWGWGADPPVDILCLLAHDGAISVRRAVASHDRTPIPTLKALAKDKSFEVRAAVMENRNTPKDCALYLFDELANDNKAEARAAVAESHTCPARLLRRLARDKEDEVRRSIAMNWSTPADLVTELARDPVSVIRCAIAGRDELPSHVFHSLMVDREKQVRLRVAENEKCPVEVFRRLSKDSDEYVRCTVARNKGCPTEILRQLSKDSSSVKGWVADNPHTLSDALRELAKDDLVDKSALANHPNTPEDVLRQLAESTDHNTRSLVSMNPHCPESALHLLSKDKEWSIRSAVVSNPRTSVDILRALAEDEDSRVSDEAKAKLKERGVSP